MASRHPDARAARQARYQEILKRTAKTLGVKTNDETAVHVAVMRFGRELEYQNMVERGTTDIASLVKIDEAIAAHVPKAKTDIEIHIVEPKSKDVTCPCGCGHVFDPYSDAAYKADQNRRNGREIVSRGKTFAPKPSLAVVCATSDIAKMGAETHRQAAAAMGGSVDPASPLSVTAPSHEGRSINSAAITVPDGAGGSHVLRPPLKRYQTGSQS